MLFSAETESMMNLPNATRRILGLGSTTAPTDGNLKFEVVLKNSSGEEIAGIWYMDGAWKISTEPMFRFSAKSDVLLAWETGFNHQTGMPLPHPREIVREDKRRSAS